MYKYEYCIIPVALQYFFLNSSVHEYNTRNRNKLRPAIANHVYRDKDFRFISVHVWNYISENRKKISTSKYDTIIITSQRPMTLFQILYSNNWYPENKLYLLQLVSNKIISMEYLV